MRKRMLACAAVVLGAAALSSPAPAQRDRTQRASPPAKAECKFDDGKTVTVDYSSPRMRGRKIYGELVPYGKVWRAGANEATTFVATADVVVGGKAVPAGSYTLYAIPEAEKWTLVISKKTGQWGIPYPGEADDLVRAEMKATQLSAPVENFTITLEPAAGGCALHLDWETTRASVAIARKK
jgi:hypothetical protein